MKIRIPYIFVSLVSLLCGIAVATILNGHSLIRGLGGDILIVIFIYSSIKIILSRISPVVLAPGVFLFACFVELLQYLNIPRYFDTKSMLIILTLGSTFDPMDIAAYSLGCIMIFLLDQFFIQPKTVGDISKSN